MQESQTISSRIRNEHQDAIKLVIEPWAEEIAMPPGSVYEVVFQGPKADCIEISSDDARLVVWGWSGSIFAVFEDGELLRGSTIPVPPVPGTPR